MAMGLVSKAFGCRPGFVADEQGTRVKTEELLPFERSDKQRYPLSVTWQPPFTMIVDLIGRGNVQVLHISNFICCAVPEQDWSAPLGARKLQKGYVHAGPHCICNHGASKLL